MFKVNKYNFETYEFDIKQNTFNFLNYKINN